MPSLYNINQVSKATGITPSVLRIWELRYHWPKPKRQPNGYRAYSQYQVQMLKRVVGMVKSGKPISSIIVDGKPDLPPKIVRRRPPRGLLQARQMPKPTGVMEEKLQQELIEALEKRHASRAMEILQRAFWQVHPKDEILTVLAPTLIGLAELIQDKRPLAEEADLRRLIKDRCLHHLSRYQSPTPEVWVVPATADDHALAALATLLLNQQGHAAMLWQQQSAPVGGRVLLVIDQELPEAMAQIYPGAERLSAVGGGQAKGLMELCKTPGFGDN
jgi:DNA-binding transcriptional MerR regulator